MSRQRKQTAPVAVPPARLAALMDAGLRLARAGRFGDAERTCRRIISVDPENADGLYLLALIAHRTGRLDLCQTMIRRGIFAELRQASQGVALIRQGWPAELIEMFGGVMLDEGARKWAAGDLDGAEECFRVGLIIKPDSAGLFSNLGLVLMEKGQLQDAEKHLRRAIALRPNYRAAYINLGLAQRLQGMLDSSVASFRRAIAIKPDDVAAHWALGIVLMSQGDFAAGWAELDWTYRASNGAPTSQSWRGEAAAGRTLLLFGGGGFGDVIQLARYAPLAAARGMRVVLWVPPTLVRLLGTVRGVAAVVPNNTAFSGFDLYCPMTDLPIAFGTTLDTVPGGTPYLHADPAETAAWAARLRGVAGDALRVGLCWAGDPYLNDFGRARMNRSRSIPPGLLAPLFDVPGVFLVSLQKGGPPMPAGLPLFDAMAEMQDFADTAALIAGLDLVVTVDTSVAHLAGALGKPVWLMDRVDHCWRWLAGRTDSPWYPTMRIFRQPAFADWGSVVAEVAAALADLAARRAAA